MIALPFIYFIAIGCFFYYRNRKIGIDIAATLLMVAISFFAIVIDVKDLYGDYGINEKAYNVSTLLLYCLQWTIALLPLHVVSRKKILPLENIKKVSLYLTCVILLLFSVYIISIHIDDIKMAIVLDAVDNYNEHVTNMVAGSSSESNYLSFIPQICTNIPFPTVALAIWLYMYSFIDGKHILKTCVFLASIVQAILSVVIAGRAALIYWIFDFFLIFCFFRENLSKTVKRVIEIVSLSFSGLVVAMLLAITFSRFDGTESRDPFDSLYAYAGQEIDNFSFMFVKGWNTPFTIDREFPLTYKISEHKTFDLMEHYKVIEASSGGMAHVFDTFGGEVFLDLGIMGYCLLLLGILAFALYIGYYWKELYFYRIILIGIYIAFFTHGIFAWPFVGHYTTFAIILLLGLSYFYKYKFRI